VKYVEIYDGRGCGWTHHNDLDKAHLSIRTLPEARKYLIAHPRCVRRMLPWVKTKTEGENDG
jgi:hypothetical protein